MSRTPEGRVKDAVKGVLDLHGAYHHWPVQNGFGAPTLDCIGCHHGKYFAIETKAFGGVLSARQRQTIEEMENAGAKVFVVYGSKPSYDSARGYRKGDTDDMRGMAELFTWLSEVADL